MKNSLTASILVIANLLVLNLHAVSYIKDVEYVYRTMKEDFENRNVSNSKGKPARMRNGFIETWNLTALIAQCEKNRHAKVEITDADQSEQDQVIVSCPCVANYILDTIQKFDVILENGTVEKAEQIPADSRQRLEESWIKIMQEGDLTFGECKAAHIE